MSPLAGGRSRISGHNRGDQRLDPDDVHYPGQIIGENREGRLGGDFWKRFCEEVRRPHAGFHRAERMFDCLAPLPHGQGIVVEAPLHFFQHVLMLPAGNPPLLAGCAASFKCTVAARVGPIAPQFLDHDNRTKNLLLHKEGRRVYMSDGGPTSLVQERLISLTPAKH